MATKAAIEHFDVEELYEFLASTGTVSEDGLQNMRKNLISGSTFFDLDSTDLKELLPLVGDRKAARKLIESYHPIKENVRISYEYLLLY